MGSIVCDVDGTICFDGATIVPEVVEALLEVRAQHEVVLASARPVRDLVPVLPPELSDLDLVGANGAIWRRGGVMGSVHHEPDVRARLSDLVAAHRLTALVDGTWDWSYSGDGSHEVLARVDAGMLARNVAADTLDVWTKVLLFTTDASVRQAIAELDVVVNVHEAEGHLDVSPRGVDKAAGLQRLWGGAREFVAFGNDANDLSLFRAARRSWCVGDHPVGEHATSRVAPHHVADALREAAAGLTVHT